MQDDLDSNTCWWEERETPRQCEEFETLKRPAIEKYYYSDRGCKTDPSATWKKNEQRTSYNSIKLVQWMDETQNSHQHHILWSSFSVLNCSWERNNLCRDGASSTQVHDKISHPLPTANFALQVEVHCWKVWHPPDGYQYVIQNNYFISISHIC